MGKAYKERLKAAHDKKTKLIETNQAIQDKADAEGRDLTEAEAKEFDQNIAAVGATNAQIERYHAQEKAELTLTETPGPLAGGMSAASPLPTGGQYGGTQAASPRLPARLVHGPTPKGFASRQDAYDSGMRAIANLLGVQGITSPGLLQTARNYCQAHGLGVQATGQVEGSNSLGGFFVPEQFEAAIIDNRLTVGIFRTQARVRPMSTDTLIFHSVNAGLTAYPVAEQGAGTLSTKTWNQHTLSAKTWQTECRYSSELAEDAIIDIAGDLAREIGRSMAYAEDQAGFVGDGTSTYHGIVGMKNLLTYSETDPRTQKADTGATWVTLDWVDFLKVMAALPQIPGIMPKWYIHPYGFISSMARIQYAAGGNTMQNIAGQWIKTFYGYPVVDVNSFPSTGAITGTFIAAFGDLNAVANLGDRRGLSVQSDPYSLMSQRQVKVFGNSRFDIVYSGLGTTTEAGPLITMWAY